MIGTRIKNLYLRIYFR